ncbi:plasmid pRiA4b ORF-3 family protein [Corynebacterium variabile]|nr:plasmid pRiA4b ORF-3 family protein [Corynebacterium variabile]
MTDFFSFDDAAIPGPVPERPHLRRDPLQEVHIFRLRISLNGSDPEIWREVLVRSDMKLSVLHQVIQASYLWWDYHLYRFALGGGAFEDSADLFLCPFDEQEPDPYQQGTPARLVRLDETVQQPGEVLHYLYDFGDNWDLTVTLVEVLPRGGEDAPVAEYVTGERAAPPEDCGSRRTAEEFAAMKADPETGHLFDDFDPEVVDAQAISYRLLPVEWWARATESPDYIPSLLAGFPVIAQIFRYLEQSPWTVFLGTKLEILEGPGENLPYDLPDAAAKAEALSGITAFLTTIGDSGPDGVKLTSAGYLPPKVVDAVLTELPNGFEWFGTSRRESDMKQVLEVRKALTRLGLLRKSRGHLGLTAAGRTAATDPGQLWNHLVERLVRQRGAIGPDGEVAERRDLDDEITALNLLCLATARLPDTDKEAVAALLTDSGWYTEGDHGQYSIGVGQVNFADPVLILLGYIGPRDDRAWLPKLHSSAAAALAREALLISRG